MKSSHILYGEKLTATAAMLVAITKILRQQNQNYLNL